MSAVAGSSAGDIRTCRKKSRSRARHVQTAAATVTRQGDLERAGGGGAGGDPRAVPSRAVGPVGLEGNKDSRLGGGTPQQFKLGAQGRMVRLEVAAVEPGVEAGRQEIGR